MEGGEVESFIKIWITATSCLCFCYHINSRIPSGILRFLSILPIITVFILLPFNLSSFHLGAPTTFYLVWLANFKLVLFSFNHGPLSSQPPLSFLHFISMALLPIKIKQDLQLSNSKINENPSSDYKKKRYPSLKNPKNDQIPSQKLTTPHPKNIQDHKFTKRVMHRSVLQFIKIVTLVVIIRIYDYRQYLHTNLILVLYIFHTYIALELVLAITAIPTRILFGFDLEPQFNEPYFSSSLQDFWGRRWNLMVTSILRPAVYFPVGRVVTRILGRKWGLVAAYLATFLVSGLMHELTYFYMTRVNPTWEVTWFFVLHGICTAVEVAVKRSVCGLWRLHWAVSTPLTLGFVAVTGRWLFFPQLTRNEVDLKAISEYAVLTGFLEKNIVNFGFGK